MLAKQHKRAFSVKAAALGKLEDKDHMGTYPLIILLNFYLSFKNVFLNIAFTKKK